MGEITRVGVDLAKRVIQVHAVDAAGRVVAAKQLQRDGRSPVALDRPTSRARRLAEGRGCLGQQTRAHPLVDAGPRPELRSRTRCKQTPPDATAGRIASGRLKRLDYSIAPFLETCAPEMHHTGQTGSR